MEVQVYSNAASQLPHFQDGLVSPAMEVQESVAAAELPSIKDQIQAMEVQESNAATRVPATNGSSRVGFPKDLLEIMGSGLLDFDSWTSLISETEKKHADNIETISLVFDSFLSMFPLCPEYWKRYTDHKMRLSTTEKVVEIFERAVEEATHSVGLWIDYCSFSMFAFTDPFNIRRLFERALSFVGKDYLCHTLWDMYLKYEFSQQQWSSLAHIIIRTLKFPTKSLHNYYVNLKKFADITEEEMGFQESCRLELQSEASPESAFIASEGEINHVINELQDSTDISLRVKALNKYISIGMQFYHKARQLDERIHCFESCIERPFFHVKPLDDNQLENWHDYLDFIEKQEDFDWAVKLYERCLIACANYPEFWMRYVEFMESKGGREIANLALARATQIFLKNGLEMHLFNARFKEQVGEIAGARAAFLQFRTESSSHFIEKTIKEANMEKRLGNLAGASDIYVKALKVAEELHTLNTVTMLYIHFYHFKYLITGSADAARDILIDGIQRVPHCRSLLEELIKFAMMHEGSRHLNVVESIIATEIADGPDVSPGLSAKDREELSCLYLEFVDLCGSCNHLRKAWNRHIKLFPHLMRNSFSHKRPCSSSNQLLNVLIEERRRRPFSLAKQGSPSSDPNNLGLLSVKEKKQGVSENQAILSDQVTSDRSQQKDGDNCVQQSMHQISLQVVQSGEKEAAIVNQTSSFLHQSGNDVSGLMETSHDLHRCREDSSGPVKSSIVMVHQSQEAASGPNELTPDFEQPGGAITPLEASERNSDFVVTEQELDQEHGVEMHLKVVSLEGLSLNSQEDESQALNPAVVEHIEPQEISIPDHHPSTVSPLGYATTVSVKTENELNQIKSGSSSSSGSHQNLIPAQTHFEPEMPSNSDEHNHEQTSSTGAITGSHGHSLEQNHQHQASPVEQLSIPQIGGRMEVLNSSHSQNQFQGAATQGGMPPVSNVLQQSSGSASQPVYAHPEAQSQYPIQSNEQLGHIQQTQAYNQILDYHYQQQHLLQQQYQQQLLQMQQPYIQQQHQQPYHQPLLQHYLQQQQQQQPQLHLSPYQFQQIQQPQYQLYHHQEQYQQYQVLVQQYQLQQEQGYLQLLQQHQLQQLQGYQQLQQYQQVQQQQQQQQQDGHQEHQQQITSMQNQRWNVSHNQQGQGNIQPCSTSTPGPSETPDNQHQSPQLVGAAATRPVVSPHSFQQSPNAVSLTGTTGSSSEALHSSSLPHQSPQS